MFSLEDNANCNLSKRETPMLQLSRLPQNVSYFLRGTQHFFRFRHHLVFSWTLILLLVYQDKATLHGLSRMGPKHICEWPTQLQNSHPSRSQGDQRCLQTAHRRRTIPLTSRYPEL